MYTYEVVTTKVIAEGVTRYEGATITELEYVPNDLGALGHIASEKEAKRTITTLYGPGAADSILYYRFKITSKYPPKWDCWSCLGVTVLNFKETE